jgi:hypothetical protein
VARQESDREDLLREATALVERAEFQLAGEAEPVVAGFRRDGSFSLFFGSERVVQFNSAGQLRRGYFEGRLLKAEKGRLVWLTRERTPEAVYLHSHPLTAEETNATLTRTGELIDCLSSHLQQGTFTLVGQVPAEGQIVSRIVTWQAALPRPIQIAPAPHAK